MLANSLEETLFGYYSDVDTFHPIQLPKGKSGYVIPCSPTLAHDGRVVCERYVFDTTTLDWQLLPEFAKFDYKVFASLSTGQEGSVSFTPIKSPGSPVQMWAAPADSFYIASQSGLELWPSSLTQAYLNTRSSIYRDSDGSLWVNASFERNGISVVHRIKARSVVTFDQNILGLSHAMLPLPWEDNAGNLKMAFFDQGIFAFKDGMWQQESPGLPTGAEHHGNFESSDGVLYSAALNYVWMRGKNESTFTRLNSEPVDGVIAPHFEESEDGTVWFYTASYSRLLYRIVDGKILAQELPRDGYDFISGILNYKGRIVVISNSSFYWADPLPDGRVEFNRFDPSLIGLKDLPKGSSSSLVKSSRNRYFLRINQENGSTFYFVGDTERGQWEVLIPDLTIYQLTSNDKGDLFAYVADGSVRKKPAGGEWTTVLTTEQIRSYGSQNSYLNWIKVDSLGRLWIHIGGPWLIWRLD
jgi:hypothetical protein